MSKLLFIAPDYYGFNEVVFEGLKEFSEYEVVHINSTLPYQYKNFSEKIYNFFLKVFCRKNIKHIRKGEHIGRIIKSNNYDLVLVNRPDVLSKENFELALSRAKKSVVIFWDSIEKIPSQKEFISKFDICYSFDLNDCKEFNLNYISNFYFVEKENGISKYDVAYLATYDHRISDAIKIFEKFAEQNISAKGKIFSYKSNPIKERLPENMEVIHKIIPFSQSYKYYLDSSIILDLAHHHQKGLSFRPYEAIGLNKKLITTNTEIINYDFYNPQNIFVIDNIQNFSIPESFINDEYKQPEEYLKEKYFIKNWIKILLKNDEN